MPGGAGGLWLASGGHAGRQARGAGDPSRRAGPALHRPLLRRRKLGRAALLDRVVRDRRGRRRDHPHRPEAGSTAAAVHRPPGRAHGLGRADDAVVDRARPELGRVRPDARLRRVRDPRAARRAGAAAGADDRGGPRRPARARPALGARRQGNSGALLGRLPRRPATESDRLLELAGARRCDRRPARPVGGDGPPAPAGGTRGRCPAPLPRRARRRPHVLTGRDRRRRDRRARLAGRLRATAWRRSPPPSSSRPSPDWSPCGRSRGRR